MLPQDSPFSARMGVDWTVKEWASDYDLRLIRSMAKDTGVVPRHPADVLPPTPKNPLEDVLDPIPFEEFHADKSSTEEIVESVKK